MEPFVDILEYEDEVGGRKLDVGIEVRDRIVDVGFQTVYFLHLTSQLLHPHPTSNFQHLTSNNNSLCYIIKFFQ